MFKTRSLCIFCVCLLMGAFGSSYAFDADDLDEVKGFTVIDITHASGTFDGADHGKLIELDNGMIFRFSEYRYSYAYRPEVVVFGRIYTVKDVKEFYPEATTGFTSYKLLIGDNFYDANRVK